MQTSFNQKCLFACLVIFVNLEKIANITKKAIESKIINTLNKTRNWTKRVQLTHATLPFDGHNSKPIEPTSTQYLRARKQLALLFKNNNIEPGRYELVTAKEIINIISSQFKDQIYEKIHNLDYDMLLKFSLANHDAYVSEPYRVCRRVNILRDYPDDKIKIYP